MALPVLRWAGGKRKLLPAILPYVPPKFLTYREPFFGGGALYFHLEPHRAVLSDTNPELTNFYRVLQNETVGLLKTLEGMPVSEASYYYYRDTWPQKNGVGDPVARAARFYYLNRLCFNGLYRTRKSDGHFNVPFGRIVPVVDPKLLLAGRLLRSLDPQILDLNFEKISVEKGDFIYCDPPYLPVTETANFVAFTREGFSLVDHKRLLEAAKRWRRQGATVLISNADTPEARKLYAGLELVELTAPRSINCDGTKRGSVGELLVILGKNHAQKT